MPLGLGLSGGSSAGDDDDAGSPGAGRCADCSCACDMVIAGAAVAVTGVVDWCEDAWWWWPTWCRRDEDEPLARMASDSCRRSRISCSRSWNSCSLLASSEYSCNATRCGLGSATVFSGL